MVADARSPGATNTGTGTTVTVTLTVPPTKSSYLLVAVGISTATNTVTGITGGTGTFVQAAAKVSANRTVELWVGYNFGNSQPLSVVVTRTAGTANMVVATRTVDVLGDCTAAPSFTASAGNTGTSTTADTAAITPAVGDLLFAGVVMASITADSTARTHTGNAFWLPTGSELTNTRVETGWSEANLAVSTSEAWTLAASVEWAAIVVKWTPAASVADAALVTKGLDTAAADAAASF